VTADHAAVLRGNILFRSLDEAELALVTDLAEPVRYPAGSHLFRESQPRRAFGILLGGRVEVVKGLQGEEEVCTC
jgi:aspartate ammonia-lyase